jgi:hypothetical protein
MPAILQTAGKGGIVAKKPKVDHPVPFMVLFKAKANDKFDASATNTTGEGGRVTDYDDE